MLKRMLLPIAMLSLSGCGTTGGSCDLLALKTYSQEYRNRLADEVAAAPADAAWPVAVSDYVALRNQVRACR
jgi:hypothetical protein